MRENRVSIFVNIIIIACLAPVIICTIYFVSKENQNIALGIETGVLTGTFLALILSIINYYVKKREAYNEFYVHATLSTYYIGMQGITYSEESKDIKYTFENPKEFVDKIVGWRSTYLEGVLLFSNINPIRKSTVKFHLAKEINLYLGEMNKDFTKIQVLLNHGKKVQPTQDLINQYIEIMGKLFQDCSYTNKCIKNLEKEMKVKVESAVDVK